MYGKCGAMVDALRMFNTVERPSDAAWTVLLQGYAENGEGLTALDLFSRMKAHGCACDARTYTAAVKACTSMATIGKTGYCLERGREIHSEIGSNMDDYLQSALVDMYSKCGSMVEARCVFDSINNPDVVSWTALVLGYAENGEGLAALDSFTRMKKHGCTPNFVSYVAALKACISLAAAGKEKVYCLERGREIHSEIRCKLDRYLQNTLIDMYAKCGSMSDARRFFDSILKPDAVSWNALLQGYAENGEGLVALDLFSRMKARGYVPNAVTYVAALKACTSLGVNRGGLERGRELHLEIGCHLNNFVEGTLIDMYATFGSMVDAARVFDKMQNPDVVSWNALLLGYADNGEGTVALDLFSKMKARGFVPNSITHVAALKACGLTGALALGRQFHTEIREFTTALVTCLVDFYAKCGSLVEARGVFDFHPKSRGVSTWNALLAGYGTFGGDGTVFNLFEVMLDEEFQPDAVTFVCMLLFCSHGGFVEKARDFFEAMPVQYGVTRTVMHYTCMVDALGRANRLNEAIALLRKMPFNPDAVTWLTLLGACRKWKNLDIGRIVFESLVGMENYASAHILMAQIYGSKGMWEEQYTLLKKLKRH